ncbi:hypothetical protein [Egbenema bharatensis]|uniref:hypothetical protein n=1 Tax=Egbenema bharatensis TaxID=3463334 RepID=UPI003A843D4D
MTVWCSERDVDYSNLARFLRKKQWKEANEETLLKLLEASGRIEVLIRSGRLVREDIHILFSALDAPGRLKVLKAMAVSRQLSNAELEALFQQWGPDLDWMGVPERIKLLVLELLIQLHETKALSDADYSHYRQTLRTDRSLEKKAIKLFLALTAFGLFQQQDIMLLMPLLDRESQEKLAKTLGLSHQFCQSESYLLLKLLSSDELKLLRGLDYSAVKIAGASHQSPQTQRSNSIPSGNSFSHVLGLLAALDPTANPAKSEPQTFSSKPLSEEEFIFAELLGRLRALADSGELNQEKLTHALNYLAYGNVNELKRVLRILARSIRTVGWGMIRFLPWQKPFLPEVLSDRGYSWKQSSSQFLQVNSATRISTNYSIIYRLLALQN